MDIIENENINREKWDALILSYTGQPYALSWWLDIVSPGWKALIKNDCEAVMPLPIKRRFGISYLVQPKFTQQLGVFGSNEINEFIEHIPYLSYDFNINYKNTQHLVETTHASSCDFKTAIPKINGINHINYIIDGSTKPDTNTRRNIAKSRTLTYKQIDVQLFMNLWTTNNGHLSDPRLLIEIINASSMRGMARIDGAYSDNQLIAALFSVITPTRIITLAPVSNQEGYKKRAMFGLMNNLIEQRENRIIDCEGSMLPGVARFYRGFGGIDQPYTRIWRLSPRRKY